MDNSWFLELDGLKLLIDPWLEGVEVDFFSWFNTQWHRTSPLPYDQLPDYNAVLITQKYPDHFHKVTLKKLQPKLVIGPSSIKKEIKKVLPETEFIGMDKKNSIVSVLDIDFHFLPTRRLIDPIYDGFVLSSKNESIYLLTHGFELDQEHSTALKIVPECTLLFTPFNLYKLPFFLGGVVSPGIKSVENLCQKLSPKVVVPTHDEDKYAKGIVSKFAKIEWSAKKEDLIKYPWLENRYQAFPDYKLKKIS
ncbi:MBL fold metallo-hydrolase [Flammeovirga pacifica]|uniref:Metallo-beta-lactamase domain-containing protein n=1 Tax=Flammeovirga pacifica TaxID=915059 RepID=A0A1S1Z4E2_FLAPC|nr:MBL fold metallo-hydrolase [Flammeovirga pacifica]OHX68097.1 hypothetical protein NH26_17970 [Flammeovirga pacifica]